MNFPTSDIQFIAGMLKKTRAGDQITVAEAARLDQIEAKGYSTEPIPDAEPDPSRIDASRGQI